MNYSLVLFYRIPILDVEGIQRNPCILLSRAESKMSHHPSEVLCLVLCPACLVFGFMFTVLFLIYFGLGKTGLMASMGKTSNPNSPLISILKDFDKLYAPTVKEDYDY